MYVAVPGIGSLGPTELILILLVLLLLFGGKKLPEMARGTGRALRIFKSETKGIMDDDDDEATTTTKARGELPPGATAAPPSTSTEYTPPQSMPPTHTEK